MCGAIKAADAMAGANRMAPAIKKAASERGFFDSEYPRDQRVTTTGVPTDTRS